ncbi:MAG TPA: hypothetical protein VJH33_01830 [Candidatus Paceibacterota bacterium]
MKEKIPVTEHGREISRRKLLIGLGALGASVALPKEALTQATLGSSKEHIAEWEKYIEDTVAWAQKKIFSDDAREAFSARGEHAFERVLQALEMPLLARHANYTKFNVNPLLNTYPIQVGRSGKGYGLRQFDTRRFLSKQWEGYFEPQQHAGNGFYFGDRNTLIVPWHVNESLMGRPSFTEGVQHTIDIMKWNVPDAMRALRDSSVLQDPVGLTNSDIHGSLVAVVGVDPGDKNTDRLGRKAYLGVAGKMSTDLYMAGFGNTKNAEVWAKFMEHAFQIILPPGETFKATRGMSGSPTFVWKNEQWALCGIYFAGTEYEDSVRKKTVYSGFFQGIDQIRLAVQK